MLSRCARWSLLGGLLLSLPACADDPADRAALNAGAIGASITLLQSGEVAVVDADHGSVSLLDPASLEVLATVPVGEEPRTLLALRSGSLLIADHRGGQIIVMDPNSRSVLKQSAVCAGPFGLASAPDESFVAVSCELAGAVLRLDPTSLKATPIASGLARPRAVAVVDDDVWVVEYTGGSLSRITPSGEVRRASLAPESAPYRPAITEMTPTLGAAIAPAYGGLYVAYQLVNNTGNTSAEPIAADYGSIVDGNPKINPAVSMFIPGEAGGPARALGPALYARFDGGTRAFNHPIAAAPFAPRYLLVANISTRDVTVIDTSEASPDARAVASFRVGAGPSGIAVDEDHQFAYVDNAFDASVSRLDLRARVGSAAPRYDAAKTLVRSLPPAASPAALAGRKIFYDAQNRHITPAAVVACATCHPEGGDDGLTWFIHTPKIPLKRRRTPDLGAARASTAPFHWNGEFSSMSDLVRHGITDLMAGDGLLVDADAVAAFLEEMVRPPKLPPGDAAAAARGALVFASPAAGCASCHGGPLFTDNAMHAVLSPMSLSADDVFPAANTPSLLGVFRRQPYLHDGRAADLWDLFTRPDAASHGGAANLSPSDLADLVAYVASL